LENVLVKARVEYYNKYPLGLRRTSVGQLILTDRRLVYVKEDHWWGGKDYSAQIDEVLQKEGSFAVSIDQVIETKVERKLAYPYLYVRYRTVTGEKPASFTLLPGGGLLGNALSYRLAPLENIASLIDRTKQNMQPG
jgi:hypothetical protein